MVGNPYLGIISGLPVIRPESYAIASRLCATPPNDNFRCVFQESLRSVFPTGDHGRHFFWLKAAAGGDGKGYFYETPLRSQMKLPPTALIGL
jgi:hypothetical protein